MTTTFQAPDSESLTLTAGRTLSHNVALSSAAFVTGKVIEQSTGFPLVGGSVSLLLPDGTIAVDQTLNDGSYSFSGLTPGEYTVMLPDGSHRQSFAVVDASSHFAINFELPFGTLSGRVLMPDGSTGDPNALVLLMQGGQVVDRTSNAAEGLYGFQLIAPGTYDLAFVDPNLTFPELTGIVIQAGENTVVPDALPGTSRLQLSVRDAANQVPGGTGFVVIRSADIPDDESLVQTIPIPSNGDVTVSNLAPGNYVVEATYGSEDSGQLEIALPAAGLTQSMTVLPTGTIAGTIASFGSAVSGLTISAYNPSTPTLVDQTTSDDQGSYSLGLAPGTYTVVVSDLRTQCHRPPIRPGHDHRSDRVRRRNGDRECHSSAGRHRHFGSSLRQSRRHPQRGNRHRLERGWRCGSDGADRLWRRLRIFGVIGGILHARGSSQRFPDRPTVGDGRG